MQLTAYQRGYIAGMIDGEGTLAFYKIRRAKRDHHASNRGFNWHIYLSIGNMNKACLETIKEWIGEGSVGKRRGQKGHYWSYSLWGNGLRKLLPQIRLIIKEKEKRLLLTALRILKKNRGLPSVNYDNELEKVYAEFRKRVEKEKKA